MPAETPGFPRRVLAASDPHQPLTNADALENTCLTIGKSAASSVIYRLDLYPARLHVVGDDAHQGRIRRQEVKNQIKTLVLLGGLTAALVASASWVGPGWAYGALALALLLNVGTYFFSDRIILRMHGAEEVSPHDAPELHAMVAELAARAQIPKPRICIMREASPNAFATGRSPKHGVVAVTEGILRILTPRELRAVLAHELAHIKNRDILISSVAAVLSSAIIYLGHALAFLPGLFGARDSEEGGASAVGSLMFLLLAPIGATLVQMGISRSREYLADEVGARISEDPRALANALAKLEQGAVAIPSDEQPATASLFIVNPLAGAGMSRLFATHPATDERIRRLYRMARSQRSRASRGHDRRRFYLPQGG